MAPIKSIGIRTWTLTHRRSFTHSAQCLVNPLLNLSHFSAAKEAQFLSKEKKIPREEFHPYLQLIRASEVDIFAPVPGASPTVIAALRKAKEGKTDSETTYTLALSNMMSQLELAKRDLSALLSVMEEIQQKRKRDERNTLLFMLAAIGLLSLIMVKTRALEDLKDYAFGNGSEESKPTPKRVGNRPPAYERQFRQAIPVPSMPQQREPIVPQLTVPQSLTEVQPATTVSKDLQPQPTIPPSGTGWTLSRLFWASSANQRAA